jgi:hypothetical protein
MLAALVLSACAGHADVPATMWTEAQAKSIQSVRGLQVRVRGCHALGRRRAAGRQSFYGRFACLASARASFQSYDTVAVTYALEPRGRFAGSESKYVLSGVRFRALETP